MAGTSLWLASAAAVLAWVASSGAAHAFEPVASSPQSLCTPRETPLFACTVGARQVAVCGVGTVATYRYGRPGRIELSSPALTLAHSGYSGGGETQITATNHDYRYAVYASMVRTFGIDGRHDTRFSSGLIVRRGGQTLSARTCDDDAPILASAYDLLPEGPFVEH